MYLILVILLIVMYLVLFRNQAIYNYLKAEKLRLSHCAIQDEISRQECKRINENNKKGDPNIDS